MGVVPALASLGDWMTWWHGHPQELVGFEEAGDRVLALVRHTGDRGGERVEENFALLFYVGQDGRAPEVVGTTNGTRGNVGRAAEDAAAARRDASVR